MANNSRGIIPIFILGYHRSGTTFFYRYIQERTQLEYLSIADVLSFCGKAPNQCFTNVKHLKNRLIDHFPFSPTMHEEYGWILKKYSGLFKITCKNKKLIDSVLTVKSMSEKKNLLLKNPWDTINFLKIAALYPKAKFIFIRRDPIAMLRSQRNILKHYLFNEDPIFSMLNTSQLNFAIIKTLKKVSNYIGQDLLIFLISLTLIAYHAFNELFFQRRLYRLQPTKYAIIDYDRYAEDPESQDLVLQKFLNLPLRQSSLEFISVKGKKHQKTLSSYFFC